MRARFLGTGGRAVTAAATPSFDPSSVPNLALWLDAISSPMTLDGSNRVSIWNDLSGNNNHATQGTLGLQPVYDATALNGLPAVIGNAGEIMNLTSSIATDPVSVLIVAQAYQMPCGLIGSSADTIHFWFYNGVNTRQPLIELFDVGKGFNDFRADDPYPTTNADDFLNHAHCQFWTQKSAGGNLRNLWNKTTQMLLSDGSSTDGTGGLGATFNQIGGSSAETATYHWHSRMALVVVYSRVLTTTEREDVTNWAINKWSIV